MIRLRRTKCGALAAVTVKRNEIKRLMESPDNFQLAKDGASILAELSQRYFDAQKKSLVEITDEDCKKKAILDFDEAIKRMSEFERKLKDWLPQTKANIHEEDIQPSDSVSHATRVTKLSKMTSRNSSASRSSKRSSISAVGVKETVKMAELNAEAEALKQRYALQKKDIKLQEEKLKLAMELEEVKLKAEIAKTAS